MPRFRLTVTGEVTTRKRDYLDGATPEDMLNVELQQLRDDPAAYLDYFGDTLKIEGVILESSEEA